MKQHYEQLQDEVVDLQLDCRRSQQELKDATAEIKLLQDDVECFYNSYMKEKEKNALLLKEIELLKAPKKPTRVFKTITKKTVFPRRLFKKTN